MVLDDDARSKDLPPVRSPTMVWVRNVLIGGFIGLVVLFAAFSIRSLVRSGEILPGVSVSGVELGGMGRATTEQALLGLE
ncbi:MAG: hypothetical protein V3V82_07380, partial [Acidimicrobiia bacterium]